MFYLDNFETLHFNFDLFLKKNLFSVQMNYFKTKSHFASNPETFCFKNVKMGCFNNLKPFPLPHQKNLLELGDSSKLTLSQEQCSFW